MNKYVKLNCAFTNSTTMLIHEQGITGMTKSMAVFCLFDDKRVKICSIYVLKYDLCWFHDTSDCLLSHFPHSIVLINAVHYLDKL